MTTEKAAVRPNVPTQRIVVQDERLIEMKVGDKRDLKVTAIPLLVSNKKTLSPSEAETAALLSALVTDKLEWSSSDGETATVDENGTVCAISAGSTKITVKSGEHEVIFNVLVEVEIPVWASEEFLEYIERIGAYTELPLGTDGSAGPTAQYVTFGFERQNGEIYHYTERGTIDERTETSYGNHSYRKGDDDEWYYEWDSTCYNSAHDHSQYPMEPYTNSRGETVTPNPYYAQKIHPRKWRLLDREKGLMVMENYDWDMDRFLDYYQYFSKSMYNVDHKDDLNNAPYVCNYETSYLRAFLNDSGSFYEYLTYSRESDGSYSSIRYFLFNMHEPKIVYSYHSNGTPFNPHEYGSPSYGVDQNIFDSFFAPSQLAQIKNENMLDCGEGEVNVQGRLFILSEDEIKQYYYNSNTPIRDSNRYVYDGKTYWTRTRKKINGKNTLCGFTINGDDTVKEFVQFDGCGTGNNTRCFIPAICVAPAPHR